MGYYTCHSMTIKNVKSENEYNELVEELKRGTKEWYGKMQ